MSNKTELQRKLKDIGYELGPFASKDTLSNVLRLHLSASENKGVDVAKLSDLTLRKNLTENGLVVGPVTNHTRAIYQRKLLEILTNETSEGKEDEMDNDIPIPITPPRATRSSIVRIGDNEIASPPGRSYADDSREPRIELTRIDFNEKNKHTLPSFYPNVSSTKTKSDQTITHTYSPQRSSTKPESRNSTASYGLRNPYDFQNDDPIIIRHEHKATPFRTSTISTSETISANTNRYTKPLDLPSTTRNELNEIRSRILSNKIEDKETPIIKDSMPKKNTFTNQLENTKSSNVEKLDAAAKNGGTFLYGGITIAVALIVFILYLWLEK
ncbi:unnamed protein product [Rotaria magnacalcarata]|uniref:LEM domain-containing protein n=3 Tax=Rotaria magnacalcarata TaxID=392030 RepID=A0A819RS09_9BILA|nr:unnamed protein product [Rotaria magnacalcarata]CAF4042532.1 unnamed protein product [Rotaria magnacalcarata]